MTAGGGAAEHEIPAGAAAIIAECAPLTRVFDDAGRRLYLVGGIVRDLFLDPDATGAVGVLDLDFTTDAPPAEVRALVGPVVDNLWTQGERFGTIAAHVAGRLVEITTHRAEAYDPGSRKPAVVFADDVGVDLSRRDFTVNAMAIELTSGRARVLDPFGGRADLERRRLTTPLSPAESFSDDPLRMLRAARFVARLAMTPDPEVVAAMSAMADRLRVVSIERVRVELDKLLEAPDPSAGLSLLLDTGLSQRFLPELTPESVPVVAAAPADPLVRLAVVLAGAGPVHARRRLRDQRRSRAEIDTVGRLVDVAGRVLGMGAPTPPVVRRLVAAAGPDLDRAVTTAAVLGGSVDAVRAEIDRLAAVEDLADLGPALDGDEVMAVLDLDAGREVGRAVQFLRELRLDEGPVPHDVAVERLRTWWAEAGPTG